jgi:hypothetical protein
MGFKSWLTNLLAGSYDKQNMQHSAEPPRTDPLEEEAAGLNFRTAIEAHQKWKARLLAVIDGSSTESLSVNAVSCDDQCVLGKWIYGAGGQQFGALEQFEKLRTNHASFHRCAGQVLQLAQAGKKSDAQTNLMSGEYARASRNVVLDLARMYQQLSRQ